MSLSSCWACFRVYAGPKKDHLIKSFTLSRLIDSVPSTISHRLRCFSRFGTFVLQLLNNLSRQSVDKGRWQIGERWSAYLSGKNTVVKKTASAVSQMWIG